MQYLFLLLGIAGLVSAAFIATHLVSDIQVILMAVCVFGGASLIGIGYLIAQGKR